MSISKPFKNYIFVWWGKIIELVERRELLGLGLTLSVGEILGVSNDVKRPKHCHVHQIMIVAFCFITYLLASKFKFPRLASSVFCI
jgi:hypothetical protein